jgi:hypothetical protein
MDLKRIDIPSSVQILLCLHTSTNNLAIVVGEVGVLVWEVVRLEDYI